MHTLCSMCLTSLYRRFLDADGLGFEADEADEGIEVDADDGDAAVAPDEEEPALEEFVLLGEVCGTKSNASSRVFSSSNNLRWVAKTEQFLHTQSFKISSRV